MIKYLHKILFIIISFSFFISATEIDLGESHNTFFDEYDTYVKTEQDTFDFVLAAHQEKDTYILVSNPFITYIIPQSKPRFTKSLSVSDNQHLPKLFLHNSVWRI